MATGPAEFSIETAERNGRVHVSVRGELDLATAPELERLINDRLVEGSHVVLDLRGLQFMDSSGVRILVAAHARAGRNGCGFTVVRPPAEGPVRRVIHISGLDTALTMIDDPGQLA